MRNVYFSDLKRNQNHFHSLPTHVILRHRLKSRVGHGHSCKNDLVAAWHLGFFFLDGENKGLENRQGANAYA